MFIENKYKTIYYQLIENARNRDELNQYMERHHIVPRSLGGTDDANNLVPLTPREHYIAHRLLTKITEGTDKSKMWWALHRMIHGNINPLSSKQYDRFRKQWAQWLSENHHSKRIPDWSQRVSNQVYNVWKDNDERRAQAAVSMKQKQQQWKRQPGYYQEQRRRSKVGSQRSKQLHAQRLEYKGKTYLGYNDLFQSTGVSKHLYQKLYKNGIDPTFRIGKDGPLSFEEVEEMIRLFVYKTDEREPISIQQKKVLLTRMVNIGIITEKVAAKHIETLKRKEASV